MIYKNPRYLPFATNPMTRSIYSIPPQYKRGGRITKAYTEILYPELARIKTQKGVPTVKRTLSRSLLFLPEYISVGRGYINGAFGRLLKWRESNKWAYRSAEHGPVLHVLLNEPPYRKWLASTEAMVTGYLYHASPLERLLNEARSGRSKYIPILGRIISQELAMRWVYDETGGQ
jgi:hypothetical protein